MCQLRDALKMWGVGIGVGNGVSSLTFNGGQGLVDVKQLPDSSERQGARRYVQKYFRAVCPDLLHRS